MSNIDSEYTKMVADLMKKGSIMKSEWTNDEKEKLRAVSLLGKYASKLHSQVEKHFFPSGIESDYEMYHMTYAFFGEVGELSDAIKKSVIYRRELDNKNVIEEFGDLLFYGQGMTLVYNSNQRRYLRLARYINIIIDKLTYTMELMGVKIEDAKEANMVKLLKGDTARYKEGKYTDEQAQKRADKNFVRLSFNLGISVGSDIEEKLTVDFYPDIPKVCFEDQDFPAEYTSLSGSTFDQELLIQMCKSKIEKEGK